MVLLAIITPASSSTRGPADDAGVAGPSVIPHVVFGAEEERAPDVPLLDALYGDVVLLASHVYEGIDLIVRRSGAAAYGFVIRPNAAADRLRLSMAGAERLEIDEHGDLIVHQRGRAIRRHRPRAHQQTPSGPVEVRADYRIGPDGDVRFALGPYDRSRALVIALDNDE